MRTVQAPFAVMVDPSAAASLKSLVAREGLPTQVLSGSEALVQVAVDERVETVMAAIVGAAGLPSCMAADRKSTRLNSSHVSESRMPSSA